MGDIGLNRYFNIRTSGLIFIILFVVLFYFVDLNSALIFVILNIIIVVFLILFFKFPEVLRTYNISKESQEAIASYDKILELNLQDTTAWNNKGTIFAKIGNFKEALKCFDKVIEIDPKNGGGLHNKGVILDNLRKPQEAIKYYDKALIIDPKLEQAKQSGKIILEK